MATVPFKVGDRVVLQAKADRRGVIAGIVRQAPDGDQQLLRVRWEDGSVQELPGRDLFIWIEKRGLGRDEGRCPECGAPTGHHLGTCSRR